MKLSDIDKRVLCNVWARERRQEPPDEQALDKAYQYLSQFPRTFEFTARPKDWANAISGLVEKGVLAHTAMYREYAQRHHLLTSAGSDSRGPDRPPIKNRAELSRGLLERVGIQIEQQAPKSVGRPTPACA